ncbi:hypothetical protein EV356DRAFT_185283 [Viridothelium virens]|uniref:Uncharacterized protein n=1 Tax=Viridothelium virens TaxID=1048519 RepID=A0A6A6H7X8_VIRVR|nr:hypothetical protein EV356DRAFT_185283 [Viridothelium virens]
MKRLKVMSPSLPVPTERWIHSENMCETCWWGIIQRAKAGAPNIKVKKSCHSCQLVCLASPKKLPANETYMLALPNGNSIPPPSIANSWALSNPRLVQELASGVAINIMYIGAASPSTQTSFVQSQDFCPDCWMKVLQAAMIKYSREFCEAAFCSSCQNAIRRRREAATIKKPRFSDIPRSTTPTQSRSTSTSKLGPHVEQPCSFQSAPSKLISYEQVAPLIKRADPARLQAMCLDLCKVSPAVCKSAYTSLRPLDHSVAGSGSARSPQLGLTSFKIEPPWPPRNGPESIRGVRDGIKEETDLSDNDDGSGDAPPARRLSAPSPEEKKPSLPSSERLKRLLSSSDRKLVKSETGRRVSGARKRSSDDDRKLVKSETGVGGVSEARKMSLSGDRKLIKSEKERGGVSEARKRSSTGTETELRRSKRIKPL